jgi:hypothetical protein
MLRYKIDIEDMMIEDNNDGGDDFDPDEDFI